MIDFNFKKKYGQNFLTNEAIIERIITNLPNTNKKKIAIEVGCGDGRLTSKLCSNFDYVIGFEIDLELKDMLENNLKRYNNYEIIYNDFIKSDLSFINKYEDYLFYVVCNVPYYITTSIIEKFINFDIDIYCFSLLVQKEAADRICSDVGNKDYSALSVLLRYGYDIGVSFKVSRNNFYPIPHVDSAVMLFTKKENIVDVNKKKFIKLVYDSFKFKSKTIKNNLRDYDLDKVYSVLKKYNLDLNTRPYKIPYYVYCDIANNLSI